MVNRYLYLVEGEDEYRLVNFLKTRLQLIVSGKVIVYNFLQQEIKKSILADITLNTMVILVFDTYDAANVDLKTLATNVKVLNKKTRNKVCTIPQVDNFEDEMVRCLNINTVNEIFNTIGLK